MTGEMVLSCLCSRYNCEILFTASPCERAAVENAFTPTDEISELDSSGAQNNRPFQKQPTKTNSVLVSPLYTKIKLPSISNLYLSPGDTVSKAQPVSGDGDRIWIVAMAPC